jgi:tetratricopeptide (TPR) repeat protein
MAASRAPRHVLARTACADAIAMATRIGDSAVVVEAELTLARLEHQQGALGEAERLLRSAIGAAAGPRQVGRAHLGLAGLAFTRGQPSACVFALDSAMSAFRAAAAPLGQADTHLLRADLWLQRANYVAAESCAHLALRLCENLGLRGKRTLGRAWLTLGRVHYESQALRTMADAFEKGLRLLEQHGDSYDLAAAMRGTAVMLTSDAPEAAASRFGASAELAREAGDPLGEARSHGDRGEILRRLGRLDEAQGAFDRETALMQQLGYERGQTQADFHQASIAYLNGDYERARAYIDGMLPVCERLGTLGQVYALELRGRIASKQGKAEEAETDFQLALARALALEHIDRVANVLRAMAAARLRRGDLEGAEIAISEALGVADSVPRDQVVKEFGILVRERLRVVQAGIALSRGDRVTARRLAESARRAFQLARAPLYVAEADAIVSRAQ